MYKGTKITPIINDLQHWEHQLEAFDDWFEHRTKRVNNDRLCSMSLLISIPIDTDEQIIKSLYEIITKKIEKLQKELKEKLKEIE